jgi:hypothetical protein
MRTGRPMPPLTLTAEEHDTLERWARRRTTAQAIALRARIVLASAAGKTNTAIAREKAGEEANRRQVAWAISREAAGRLAR